MGGAYELNLAFSFFGLKFQCGFIRVRKSVEMGRKRARAGLGVESLSRLLVGGLADDWHCVWTGRVTAGTGVSSRWELS